MPLVKANQSFSAPIPARQVSPVCWTGDLIWILHLDTFSTVDHPSPVVQAGKAQKIMAPAVQLLQAGICHRRRAPHKCKLFELGSKGA